MSNPENIFQKGLTYEQWLAAYGDLVQGKVDKPGGVVPPEGTNVRAGAVWSNAVDDLMLTIAEFGVATTPQFSYVENTAAPISVPALDGATNEEFEFPVTFNSTTNAHELLWVSLTRDQDNTSVLESRVIISHRSTPFNYEPIHTFSTVDGNGTSPPEENLIANFDYASSPGCLMGGPFAKALEEPVAGQRRFYVRVKNVSAVGNDMPPCRFAYVIRELNLSLTEIPERTRFMPS